MPCESQNDSHTQIIILERFIFQNFYVSLCLATFYQFPNNQLDQKCDMHVLIRFKAVSAMPEYTTHVYILLFAYLILFALLIWFSSCYYF